MSFIDQHGVEHGVELICKLLPIAPSTYYEHKAKERNPDLRSRRDKSDEILSKQIARVHEQNMSVYGVRKVWLQLAREGLCIGRCTVERLMRKLGLEGATRGRTCRTTDSYHKQALCVNLQLDRPSLS